MTRSPLQHRRNRLATSAGLALLTAMALALQPAPAAAATGDLTQPPRTPAACTSDTGTSGACVDGVFGGSVSAVAVSPDGENAYVTSAAGGSVAVFDRDPGTGALTQKPGTAGCVSETGSGGACADGVGLAGAQGVAVSPDGASVYVASFAANAIAVFDRNPSTGALTQKAGTAACVSENGSGGACSDGVALQGPIGIAVSPTGTHVYVASTTSDAVLSFDRDTGTGAVAQKAGTTGCTSETGTGGACVDGKGLDGARGLRLSPDGANVYVASSEADAVAVLDRAAATGVLTQKAGTAGCVSETGSGGACSDGVALDTPTAIAISPDGAHVYVTAVNSAAVTVFDRAGASGVLTQKPGTAGCVSEMGTGGACADGSALTGANSVAVAADGASVYVSSFGISAVAVFDRDVGTGSIAQKPGVSGCLSDSSNNGACQDATAMVGPSYVVLSPDDDHVYVAVQDSASVVTLTRAAGGALTQDPGTAGCLTQTGAAGACLDGRALLGARDLALSGDGRNAYVAAFSQDTLAVLARDPGTGDLSQDAGATGCFSETEAQGCTDARGLDEPSQVAVSPDDKSVYVTSAVSDSIAVFDRDTTTGALTQKAGVEGCISETGSSGACTDGMALDNARGIAVSPDGKNVYVTGAGSGSVVVLDRDPTTGALTQKAGAAGCVSDDGSAGACADGTVLVDPVAVVVSGDGTSVYVAARSGHAISIFDRSTSTGALTQKAGTDACIGQNAACAAASPLRLPQDLAMSPDGSSVYVAASDEGAVVVLDRSTATGALTRKPGAAGCISELGSGECADGSALTDLVGVTVSPDGESVYTASAGFTDAVAIFDRDPTGALTQDASTSACASQTGVGCAPAQGLDGATGLAVSPDDAHLYVAAFTSSGVAFFDREQEAGPQTTITGGVSGPTNDSTPTFAFSSADAGATYECAVDGGAFGPCSGPGASHTTTPLADGPHTFRVRAVVAAVPDPSPAERSFTVDTAAPQTTIDSGPSGTTDDTTPTFAFSSSEGGASFECRLDSAAYAACSGPGSTHTTATLGPGPHTFEVRATDSAGNVDGTPATRAFTVAAVTPPDTTPPSVSISSKPKKTVKTTKAKVKVTVAFTSESGARFECKVGKAAFRPCSSPFSVKLKSSASGKKHTIQVVAVDAAGNRSPAAVVRTKVKRIPAV